MHTDRAAPPKVPNRQRRGPRERLADALVALGASKGQIVNHSEKNWASITFAGARHRVKIVFEGEDAVEAGEGLITFLPEHEFAIAGHLVADAAVVEVYSKVYPSRLAITCELLLLEEG